MVNWEIKGREYVNCNCDYSCPCQFNLPPTHGDCRAVGVFEFDEGHFGKVRLDGLRSAMLVAWPGPIHRGDGTMQIIVDERADEAQRDALVKIMTGQDTREMATMWSVFSAMSPTKLEPVVRRIDLDVDIDARRARLVIPGVVESSAEPIRNPVTGAPHRVRISLPNGFEYRLAEIGSGTSTAAGSIPLDLKGTYSQFANLHLCQDGVIED